MPKKTITAENLVTDYLNLMDNPWLEEWTDPKHESIFPTIFGDVISIDRGIRIATARNFHPELFTKQGELSPEEEKSLKGTKHIPNYVALRVYFLTEKINHMLSLTKDSDAVGVDEELTQMNSALSALTDNDKEIVSAKVKTMDRGMFEGYDMVVFNKRDKQRVKYLNALKKSIREGHFENDRGVGVIKSFKTHANKTVFNSTNINVIAPF